MLTQLTASNYRCFGTPKFVANFAPLTLITGENGTGKTTLLSMARVLHEMAFHGRMPEFGFDPMRRAGGKDGIYREGRVWAQANWNQERGAAGAGNEVSFNVIFDPTGPQAFPFARTLSVGNQNIGHRCTPDQDEVFAYSDPNGKWANWRLPRHAPHDRGLPLPSMTEMLHRAVYNAVRSSGRAEQAMKRHGQAKLPKETLRWEKGNAAGHAVRLFALKTSQPGRWKDMKKRLETFGRDAGLFHRIDVRQMSLKDRRREAVYTGETLNPEEIFLTPDPEAHPGATTSLSESGTGTRRAVQAAIDLLWNRPGTLIWEHPTQGWHPRAEAAFGSLLLREAHTGRGRGRGRGRQIIIETHSDLLQNRIRIEAREKGMEAIPEIALIYLEKSTNREKGNRVWSCNLEENQRWDNVPGSYRRFFMKEVNRRLGAGA